MFFDHEISLWPDNLVSESLILAHVDIEVLLVMFQILLFNLGNVLLDVGERIGNVFFTPETCIKQYIDNRLFLNEHLITLVFYSLRDPGCLGEVDAMRGRSPVVLNRDKMWSANKDTSAIRGLHHIAQHRGHVEVLRHQEDVTEIC